jgi:DNA-directed RNA polymerase subunit RPC12/RpoP
MKAEGFFEASLNPYDKGDAQRGFTCVECGFGSWFRKCSRCGHENGTPERDGE